MGVTARCIIVLMIEHRLFDRVLDYGRSHRDQDAFSGDKPAVFREAVWLRDVEEFSYAEIADMLQIPVGTVMSRISRGRRMLFDALKTMKTMKTVTTTTTLKTVKTQEPKASHAGLQEA